MENLNTNAKVVKKTRSRKAVIAPKESFKITGDHQYKIVEAPVAALVLDTTTSPELLDINNPVNQSHLSGKGAGTVVLNKTTKVPAVSVGDTNAASWVDAKGGSSFTPAGVIKVTTQSIGDGKRRQKRVCIASHFVPVVTKAELLSAPSAINRHALSGKAKGAIVIDETGHIYMAADSESTSVWANLTVVANSITPVGAVAPTTSSKLGDRAVSRKSLLSAFPLTLTTKADLLKLNNPINDSRVSGKKLGACFALGDDIAIAQGDTRDAAWVLVTDGSSLTPVA